MRTPKINTGFSTLSDANFENKAQVILSSMTGNANFPTPTPSLADVQTAITAYSDALVAAKSREKNAVALKNQKRDELTAVLVQLASYVMLTANGDRAILISSGFDLAKEGGTTVLTTPENIQVENGVNPGELVVSVTAVKGAKSYVHQLTQDPVTLESDWTQVNSSASRYTFKNLDLAKRYWFRVAAVGPFDQVVISDAASRIVQ